MDPADSRAPALFLTQSAGSPEPMRRANQPEEVKCCAETVVDAGEVDHQHGHPESRFAVHALCGGSREVDAMFGRECPANTWRSYRTPRSIHNAFILSNLQECRNFRCPFRPQFRSGLNHTLRDYLSRLRTDGGPAQDTHKDAGSARFSPQAPTGRHPRGANPAAVSRINARLVPGEPTLRSGRRRAAGTTGNWRLLRTDAG